MISNVPTRDVHSTICSHLCRTTLHFHLTVTAGSLEAKLLAGSKSSNALSSRVFTPKHEAISVEWGDKKCTVLHVQTRMGLHSWISTPE